MVKLNTNENAYPPSPAVAEAVRRAAEALRLYPDPDARSLVRCHRGIPRRTATAGILRQRFRPRRLRFAAPRFSRMGRTARTAGSPGVSIPAG